MEAMVFKGMSDQDKGPKLLFYDGKIRMEEFINGRVLSIWECRNPVIIKAYAEAQVDMFFNKDIRDKYEKMEAINPDNMAIDKATKIWGPDL